MCLWQILTPKDASSTARCMTVHTVATQADFHQTNTLVSQRTQMYAVNCFIMMQKHFIRQVQTDLVEFTTRHCLMCELSMFTSLGVLFL